jgi:hypothetical protein
LTPDLSLLVVLFLAPPFFKREREKKEKREREKKRKREREKKGKEREPKP